MRKRHTDHKRLWCLLLLSSQLLHFESSKLTRCGGCDILLTTRQVKFGLNQEFW